MEFYINVPFFLIPLVATVACAILAFIVEAIARGDGGKVTYVFTFLLALVGAFLAIHWDDLGVRDLGDLVLHGALASTIVMACFISGFGATAGKTLYEIVSTPAWLKDDEEAALKAISKEKNQGKLEVAARTAKSYRVRAIAYEKLGHPLLAKRAIAIHDPDEVRCLAALDGAEWDGLDELLAEVAASSNKEAVALKALSRMQDNKALSFVASKAKNEDVAFKALSRIDDASILEDLAKQEGFNRAPGPIRFEAGRRLKSPEVCVVALNNILEKDVDGVKKSLDSLEDASFRAIVIKRWLKEAKDASSIVERLEGRAIVDLPVGEELEGYLCPSGCVHDFEATTMHFDAASDDYYGIVHCKACGYRYHVSGATYMSGKHLFGCKNKEVVLRG